MEYKYKNFLMGCGQTCQARALIVMTAIGGESVGALVSPLLGEKRGVGALVGAALSGLGMTLLQMDNLKGKKRNVKRQLPCDNPPCFSRNQYNLEEPKSQSDCGDGHEFIPRGGTRKKAFCQALNNRPNPHRYGADTLMNNGQVLTAEDVEAAISNMG